MPENQFLPYISRKSFLQLSSLFLFSCAAKTILPKTTINTRPTKLYLPYNRLIPEVPHKNGLLIVDLCNHSIQSIEMPFSIHLLETSNLNKSLSLGANKYGRYFIEFDLQEQKLIQVHQTPKGIDLSGHMQFSHDDRYLCATAIDTYKNYTDCVLTLNPKNFKIEDIIYLKKGKPSHHDCHFVDQTYILATTANNSIDFVDVSKKINLESSFDLNPKSQQLRHLIINKQGHIALQSNTINTKTNPWGYSQAQIATLEKETQNKVILDLKSIDPELSNAEILDFTFDQNGKVLAATHGLTHKISFWDFDSKKLIKILELPEGVMRISYDSYSAKYIVAATSHIFFVDQHSLEVTDKILHSPLKNSIAFSHKTLI